MSTNIHFYTAQHKMSFSRLTWAVHIKMLWELSPHVHIKLNDVDTRWHNSGHTGETFLTELVYEKNFPLDSQAMGISNKFLWTPDTLSVNKLHLHLQSNRQNHSHNLPGSHYNLLGFSVFRHRRFGSLVLVSHFNPSQVSHKWHNLSCGLITSTALDQWAISLQYKIGVLQEKVCTTKC